MIRRAATISIVIAAGALVAIVSGPASRSVDAARGADSTTTHAAPARVLDERGPGFEHIAQQSSDFAADNREDGAIVVHRLSGASTVRDAETTRLGSISVATEFDPNSGQMILSEGTDIFKIVPLDRGAPASVELDASTTTVVTGDTSEITIATASAIEQHRIIDEPSARAIVNQRFRVEAPAGVTLRVLANELRGERNGEPVFSARAPFAKDEIGNTIPLRLDWDPIASIMSVRYDGTEADPVGRVAIDPIWTTDPTVGEFNWEYCQTATGAVCGSDSATPALIGPYPATSPDFSMAQNSTWGTYLTTKQTAIASASGYEMLYQPPANTAVLGADARFAVFDYHDNFGCRIKIIDEFGSMLAQSTFAQSGGVPSNSVSRSISDASGNGAFFTLRIQNTSGASVTTTNPDEARCWMPDSDDTGTGGSVATRSRFLLRLKDTKDPEATIPASLPLSLEIVPSSDVSADPAGDPKLVNPAAYSSMHWNVLGDSASVPSGGSDEGSGISGASLHFKVAPGVVGSVVRTTPSPLCPSPNNAGGPPCNVKPFVAAATIDATIDGSTTVRQGLNPYWIRVTDYSGRADVKGPVYFLYDTVAPDPPAPTTGGVDEASAWVIDANNTWTTSWNDPTDPGEAPVGGYARTGSGVKQLTRYIAKDGDAGPGFSYAQWRLPAVSQRSGLPPFGFPSSDTFDAEQGMFRYNLRATDEAGNVGAQSASKYVYVDTTPPRITRLIPDATVGAIQVRKANQPISFRYLIEEDSEVAEQIDEHGLEMRPWDPGSHNSYRKQVTRPGENPGTKVTSMTFNRSGNWDVRPYVEDGPASMPRRAAPPIEVCADTAIAEGDTVRMPYDVTAIPLHDARKSPIGARLNFRVQPQSDRSNVVYWMIERRKTPTSKWLFVDKIPAGPSRDIEYTQTFPSTDTTQWRVSPATLPCTFESTDQLSVVAETLSAAESSAFISRTRQLLGLEPHWSYRELPVGGGATASVNVAVGNLVVSKPLLVERGVGMDTEASLVYNSQQWGDDERVAAHGPAGKHWRLAVGRLGSPGGSLDVAQDAAYLTDADGTRHAFTRGQGQQFNQFSAPAGTQLLLESRGSEQQPVVIDGISDVRYVLTTQDGIVYYFGEDPSQPSVAVSVNRRAHLLARRDRQGNTIRFTYECVAIGRSGTEVTDVKRVRGGALVGFDEAGEVATRCPDRLAVAGLADSQSLVLRLNEIRSVGYEMDPNRRVTLEYDALGHVAKIAGHGDSKRRSTVMSFDSADRLTAVEEVARDESSRRIGLSYDASLDDRTSRFDQGVLLSTITDYDNKPTRFSYRVPDLTGNSTVNPRVSLMENREDVRENDQTGIRFRYQIGFLGELSGVTSVDDQLDRRSIYEWRNPRLQDPISGFFYNNLDDDRFGTVSRAVAPSGLETLYSWDNATMQVSQVVARPGRVEREPVRLIGTSSSMLRNGPAILAGGEAPVVESRINGNWIISTGSFSISSTGLISARAASAPSQTVYVTYSPAPIRSRISAFEYDPASGQPRRLTSDQRAAVAPDGSGRELADGSRLVNTSLEYGFSGGAPSYSSTARALVQDLAVANLPNQTTSRFEVINGLTTGVSDPHPNGGGGRVNSSVSFNANGTVASTRDAAGRFVTYSGYDANGMPRYISRPAMSRGGRGLAYEMRYDDDANITCLIDLRGQSAGAHSYGNRYATFQYDAFGNMTRETAPWQTTDTSRLRRRTDYSVDVNGNRVRTESNRSYSMPHAADPTTDCADQGKGADAGTAVLRGADTEYDLLDRIVKQWSLPNDESARERLATTRYNRAGDVTLTVEPLGNATSQGGDYSTAFRYNAGGQLVETTDGIGRRTCTYPDQFDDIRLIVAAEQQGKSNCSDAPAQGLATRNQFDNAGRLVWSQSPSGSVSRTRFDVDSNAVRQDSTDQLAEGGDIVTIATTASYGPAGNVLVRREPTRQVCVGGITAICGDKQTRSVAATTTFEYDELGRLKLQANPRSMGDADQLRDLVRYAYNDDGDKIRESRVNAGTDIYSHTQVDAFGNPVATSVNVPWPNPTSAAVARHSTHFEYGDDNAPLAKDDVAHDVRVRWEYDRDGRMTSRFELGARAHGKQSWTTRQDVSYWPDGSLKTAPFAISPYVRGRVYRRGTCVRSEIGNDGEIETPDFVYHVDGKTEQLGSTVAVKSWSKWPVGKTRTYGQIKLTKAHAGPATHHYDANGQLKSIDGCGMQTEWTQRDGVGHVTETNDSIQKKIEYAYDDYGRLARTRYTGGREMYRQYIRPDTNPDTLNPGVGMLSEMTFGTRSRNASYASTRYAYSIGGSILRRDQMAAGTFDGPNPRLGFTRYFYDPSGQLAKLQSYRQRAGSPAQAAYVERILRDIDGNPRRIEDSIRYADPTKNAYPSQTVSAVKNPWRSRVRNFGYDNQGRVVRDKLGAPIPERRYEYDDLGRLETVTSPYRDPKTKKVSQRLVDRYGFGADDRARGAMLPLRHDSRTKVTDKLRDGRIFYGNGFTTDHYVNGKVASFAGPRGSVVLNRTRESPVDPKLVRDERYTFNRMGNLSRSTVTSYEPARRPCQIAGPLPPSPKKNVKAKTKPRASCKEEHRIGTGPRAKVRIFEGRAAAVIESEHPVYDIRSRRIGALNTVDVTAQSNEPTTDLDVFYLEANAEDPYAESTVESSPTSPYSRWIMRDDIGIVAETRQDTTRYFNTDHQGSVMQLVDGTRRGTIRATFDYDTFGTSQQDDRDTKKPDPKAAFVSGSTQERAWTAYTYTGMRLSSNGATTNHHARDYNAASRQWLQSDQYMNPWADVGLSLNSSTRDRHRYANGNPVGNTDTNGHCVGSIGWFCPLDPDPSPPSGFTPKPTPNPPFKPKPTPSNGAPGDTLITGLPGPGSTTPSTRPSAQTRIVVATSSFVSGVGANGIDAVRSSAQTMSAACATNPQGSCMAGLTQMVGSAGYDCVSSSGFGGCGGRIYGAGENYYNGCRSAMGDAYALGKGCGGDAIFALAGGMGGAKIATKGVVRSVGGRTPGGIPYTRHFEVETPAKFPDRYQPSGAEIDRVVGSPDWMATRLGNRATSYYNLDMDMTVVLGRNGVMSAHNGTPMNPNRMGMQ